MRWFDQWFSKGYEVHLARSTICILDWRDTFFGSGWFCGRCWGERAFYPTVLIVIASYYVLFAVMGASRRTLIIEIVIAGGFFLAAVLGFRRNVW